MQPELTIYFSPGACSRVSLIALEQSGADYCAQRVALAEGEHKRPDYLALNPKAKVPTLQTAAGALTETVAILHYLDARFPAAGLLPTNDDWGRAQANAWLAWCSSTLHPLIFRARMATRVCDLPYAAPRVKELALVELADQLAVAEARLAKSTWLLSQSWCIADAYLFWSWSRATESGLDAGAFPYLAAHAASVRIRPETRRAIARETSAAVA